MTSPQDHHDLINEFLLRLRSEPDLQRAIKPATTAAEVADVAKKFGLELTAADLVKNFAQRLLEADDALAVRLFDNCGWDHGEIAWVLKTWEHPAA